MDKLKQEDIYSSIHKLKNHTSNLSKFEKLKKYIEKSENNNNYIYSSFVNNSNGQPLRFDNLEEFENWSKKEIYDLNKEIKFKLTPNEFYLTQRNGT